MAWTSYDDQLAQQAIAMMTDPNWQSDTTITNPQGTGLLDKINSQLQTAGATLGSTQDAQMNALLKQFNDAYTAGNAANTSRYNQILAGYGTQEQNAQMAQQNTGSAYGQLINQNAAGNNAVTSGYLSQQQALTQQLANLGTQSKQDVANTYAQQGAATQQDMANRGLGNTTVQSSAMQGNASAQATSMNQLNQQLTSNNLNYQTQWGNSYLSALQGANQNSTALGLQNLGFQQDVTNQNAALAVQPLQVMENRTDLTPSLSDIANLTMQLGRGSAQTAPLGQLQAAMSFGSGTSVPGSTGLFGQ